MDDLAPAAGSAPSRQGLTGTPDEGQDLPCSVRPAADRSDSQAGETLARRGRSRAASYTFYGLLSTPTAQAIDDGAVILLSR